MVSSPEKTECPCHGMETTTETSAHPANLIGCHPHPCQPSALNPETLMAQLKGEALNNPPPPPPNSQTGLVLGWVPAGSGKKNM